MLYEGLKQNATIVIVPSTVLNTMTLGDMTGTVSLAKILTEEKEQKKQETRPTAKRDDELKRIEMQATSAEKGAL